MPLGEYRRAILDDLDGELVLLSLRNILKLKREGLQAANPPKPRIQNGEAMSTSLMLQTAVFLV